MKNTKPDIKPLTKINQAGRILYGVEISNLEEFTKSKQIWRAIEDYRNKQKQLAEMAFDYEYHFNGVSEKMEDREVFDRICKFYAQAIERQDIYRSRQFRVFLELPEIECEYLDQWMKQQLVPEKDMIITQLVWDTSHMNIFLTCKPKTKIKKITSFFKELLSADKYDGRVMMFVLRENQFVKKWDFSPDAQILSLRWSEKAGILHLCTIIGIYIYTVQLSQTVQPSLLEFVKIFEYCDSAYAPKLGLTIFCDSNKIYAHSLSKQFQIQLTPNPIKKITALAISQCQNRLYVSTVGQIRIYQIKSQKQISLLSQIEGYSPSSQYSKIILSNNNKYIFGLNSSGFISVIENKPQGKEKLMRILTNIDCPANTRIFAFNERNQFIVLSYGSNIVLMSTKNCPLFSGKFGTGEIVAGTYDDRNNIILSADQNGFVRLYNICIQRNQ